MGRPDFKSSHRKIFWTHDGGEGMVDFILKPLHFLERVKNPRTCNTRHSRGSGQLWEHAQHPALSSWLSSLGKPAHILKDSVNASIAIVFFLPWNH